MTEENSTIWKALQPIGDKKYPIELEVKVVKIEQLRLNALNPNVMDESRFKYLKENIKRMGYGDYIATAIDPKQPDVYFVMDGAHRALALREEGYGEIPILVAKGLSMSQIFSASFTYNKPRGRLDATKTMHMLWFGVQEWGEEELRKQSGLDRQKWDEFLALIKAGKGRIAGQIVKYRKMTSQTIQKAVVSGKKQLQATVAKSFKRLLMVSLETEDYDFVVSVLSKYDVSPAVAIVKLCKEVAEEKGWN